jgi:hypothetical protein
MITDDSVFINYYGKDYELTNQKQKWEKSLNFFYTNKSLDFKDNETRL